MNDTQARAVGSHLRDARAIHDMAELRFEVLPEGGARVWALIRVTPEPHSGSATFADAMIEGETGMLVDAHTRQPIPPGQAKPRIIKQGSWELLRALSRASRMNSGEYSWMEPPRSHIRRMTPDDLYSPFAGGGIILCGHDPAAEGMAQFQPVHLVPEGWAAYVEAAWEQFRTGPPYARRVLDQEATRRLAGLMADPNPIVATLAFRDFIRAGKDQPDWSAITGRRDGREAEFTYTLLEPRDPVEKWRTWLEHVSEGSGRAVALGALAAAILGDPTTGAPTRACRLLEVFREKAGVAFDPLIGEVFKTVGLAST